MPRYQAQRVVRQESSPKYDYTVRTVRAQSQSKFSEGGEFRCASAQDAMNSADRMQREFDDDCDPCRTYVFRGEDKAPIYAGLQNMSNNGGYRGR